MGGSFEPCDGQTYNDGTAVYRGHQCTSQLKALSLVMEDDDYVLLDYSLGIDMNFLQERYNHKAEQQDGSNNKRQKIA